MANDGQVNKMFHVFGSKSKEILNQFMKLKKNRFYLDSKFLGERYCEFVIIDSSEIEGKNFNQWIEGIEPITPIIFIVNDKQFVSDDLLIDCNLKLSDEFESHYIFSIKNHEELVSVLEGVSELQNRFSLMEVDFADFMQFLRYGQYYWSDTVYSQSIDILKLRVVEKIENVNARAKKSGLKVSGIIGCMKGNAYSSVVDDFELLSSTFKKNESVFDYDSTLSIFHSNLSEGTDMNEGSELGYHMLWALSHK
jgi:hypothetical protein